MVLPLLGLGKVWDGDAIVETRKSLEKYQLKPLQLQAKEGLALINGTQFILAHAIFGLEKFEYLFNLGRFSSRFFY